MEKDLIIDREKMYRLFENEQGEKSLGVLCGGIAMYEIKFKLSADELEKYEAQGKGYLDLLSYEVAKHPGSYETR